MTLKPARLQWAEDGALRSVDYDDIYFQAQRGPEESGYTFLEKNRLRERFSALPGGAFRIAELGFGTGLNFLLTAALWARSAPAAANLTYVSVEKHPVEAHDLRRVYAAWPELAPFCEPLLMQYPPLIAGFHTLFFREHNIRLMLLFGDVAEVLPQLTGRFDAWYLDGFSPAKNPAMWEENIFLRIADRTARGGTLSTFSAAGTVRRGLQAAGFTVEKTEGFGVKRDMTVATLNSAASSPPSEIKNIAVLGAGIAGASAAFALAHKGFDVTVIERREKAAAETSGNPLAVVYPKMTIDPSPFGAFHQHGFCFTRALAIALRLPSWNPCGVLRLDISEEDARRHGILGSQGYPADYLRYDGGLLQASAGTLSPPEFCHALLDHAKIAMRYSTTVESLKELDGYDAVVIALGPGCKVFQPAAQAPLQSLRGQVTFLKETPVSKKITQVICHEGVIAPALDGIHTIGATFQREEPAEVLLRDGDNRENMQKLEKNIPGFGFAETDIAGGRAGYRITTRDKLPVIGAFPGANHVYCSTAFGAHGMTGAPLAGEIVACLVAGDSLPVPENLTRYLAPKRLL